MVSQVTIEAALAAAGRKVIDKNRIMAKNIFFIFISEGGIRKYE